MEVHKKITEPLSDPAIPLLGSEPEKLKLGSERDICTPVSVFPCSLQHYSQQPRQKQPKCPMRDEWGRNVVYTHNTLATWCKELTHWKRPWCWERLKAGGEGDNRGKDGWMAPLTQWTWVWASSKRWWNLAHCSSWGCKESDMTQRLNNNRYIYSGFVFLVFSHKVVSDSFATPWTRACQAPLSMGFPRQEYGMGCHFFLQVIFLTQGWKLRFLHWQVDSLPLSHQGSPIKDYYPLKRIQSCHLQQHGRHFAKWDKSGTEGQMHVMPLICGN